MQELIEELKANDVAHGMYWIKQPNDFFDKYLEKEKEQINKAYYQGIYDKNEGLIKEEYYHETYNPTISKITITEINTRKQRIIDMMKDDEDLGLYSPI